MTWTGGLFVDRHVASLYPEGLAVDYGVRYLLMGGVDEAMEGRLGDAHLVCSLFLRKPQQVLEPHGLHLVVTDDDLLYRSQRYPGRFEEHRFRLKSYTSLAGRSRHLYLSVSISCVT